LKGTDNEITSWNSFRRLPYTVDLWNFNTGLWVTQKSGTMSDYWRTDTFTTADLADFEDSSHNVKARFCVSGTPPSGIKLWNCDFEQAEILWK